MASSCRCGSSKLRDASIGKQPRRGKPGRTRFRNRRGLDRVYDNDYIFVVVLSRPGGSLNVLNAPRPSGALLRTLPNGAMLANVGGCTLSDGEQWCEVQAERGRLRG